MLDRYTLSSRQKTAGAFASRVLISASTSSSLDITLPQVGESLYIGLFYVFLCNGYWLWWWTLGDSYGFRFFPAYIQSNFCTLFLELGNHLLAHAFFLRHYCYVVSEVKSVKRFRFCQTMLYSDLSIVLRMTKSMIMMKRNGERKQPCRTPETISKNSVYPLAAAGVVIQCLEDINEPVRNAVVC